MWLSGQIYGYLLQNVFINLFCVNLLIVHMLPQTAIPRWSWIVIFLHMQNYFNCLFKHLKEKMLQPVTQNIDDASPLASMIAAASLQSPM